MTVFATTERDGSAIVTIAADRHKILGETLEETRAKISDLVIAHAQHCTFYRHIRPVRGRI